MNKIPYFADLTSYSHQIEPFTLIGVKNVGWLDVESTFPLGDIPKTTFLKLISLAGGSGSFRPLVEPVRELTCCQICGPLELRDSTGKILPSAELWIPARETIYAAPIMILHFISVHNYLPPAEFIAAIDEVDEHNPFVADEIYREQLRLSDWGRLSGEEKMDLAAAYIKRTPGAKPQEDIIKGTDLFND
ncbi:hypothetical protein [Pseudomonas fluorescens]|uniref:DUF7919 family protein n=1 Tax=Pseudomonas fluorescens TaxID=294 RepID=UPI0011171D44|nr:hypothetical protein [Pseudomonas fluorescens]